MDHVLRPLSTHTVPGAPDRHIRRLVQGETVFQLNQIKRTEPPSDLFEVPSGYRVTGADEPKRN